MVVVIILVCFLVIFRYCSVTRCIIREPRQGIGTGAGPSQLNETYEMKQPDIHVSPNKHFHSGDMPELRRQNARPNGSRNNSLDPLESIYNVSMISAVSGESALTDAGSLSNPPSPTVSDIYYGEKESPFNRYLTQGEPSSFVWPGDEGHQHRYHHYDKQGYCDQRPENLYHDHNYAPSQISSFSRGRSSRLHMDQEHSRRHSASPHLPRERHHRRHSPSSHHSDRYSNHHSDHHRSRSRSPRSRSLKPAFEPAHFTQEYPPPSHNQSLHVLTIGHVRPPRGPLMRPTRSAEWIKPTQHYQQQQQEQMLYQQPPLPTERHHTNEPDTATSPVSSHIPALAEKDSPSADEGPVPDRYTSQDSSSSLQSTSMPSSGQLGKPTGKISVFDESSVSGGLYTSTNEKSATDPKESVRRRQHFVQNELTHDSESILPSESGYSTSVYTTDSKSTSHRSRLPPENFPIPTPRVPAKKINIVQAAEQQEHLVPSKQNIPRGDHLLVSSGRHIFRPRPYSRRRRSAAMKEASALEKSRFPAGLLGQSEKQPPTLLPQDQLSMWSGHDSGYSGSDGRSSSTKTRSSTTYHTLPGMPETQSTRRAHMATASRYYRLSSPTSYTSGTTHMSDVSSYVLMNERFYSNVVPSCVTPTATLSHCTSKGRKYYDKFNDFSLEIPEGAIPEGESITIDIGVALYGPFQYPEGVRPVSPLFWVCVRDQRNFRFSKPVKVTLPHFLKLENEVDIESLGMTFLKGDHEMTSQQVYQFQQAEGEVIIEPRKRNGILRTTHFCYLCITSKQSRMSIQKAMFCIYAAIPRTMSPREPAYVYFFMTFLLKTCLQTVRKQIINIPELREHKKVTQDFQFSKYTGDPALDIVLPQTSPDGWTVGLQFSKQVGLPLFLALFQSFTRNTHANAVEKLHFRVFYNTGDIHTLLYRF